MNSCNSWGVYIPVAHPPQPSKLIKILIKTKQNLGKLFSRKPENT